jgi:hypothetical protein
MRVLLIRRTSLLVVVPDANIYADDEPIEVTPRHCKF